MNENLAIRPIVHSAKKFTKICGCINFPTLKCELDLNAQKKAKQKLN